MPCVTRHASYSCRCRNVSRRLPRSGIARATLRSLPGGAQRAKSRRRPRGGPQLPRSPQPPRLPSSGVLHRGQGGGSGLRDPRVEGPPMAHLLLGKRQRGYSQGGYSESRVFPPRGKHVSRLYPPSLRFAIPPFATPPFVFLDLRRAGARRSGGGDLENADKETKGSRSTSKHSFVCARTWAWACIFMFLRVCVWARARVCARKWVYGCRYGDGNGSASGSETKHFSSELKLELRDPVWCSSAVSRG